MLNIHNFVKQLRLPLLSSPLREGKKLKLLFSVMSLILLICLLSFLDSPEYVNCTHLGICELLELHGILDITNEAQNAIKNIKEKARIVFPIKEDQINISYLGNPTLNIFPHFYFLSRYINLYHNQSILPLPLEESFQVLDKEKSLATNFIYLQPLHIITSSIIIS